MSAAFDAPTLCGAFQITVAARGDRVALRTRGDATRYTWREYGEHVRRYTGALAGAGVRPGEAVAILMTNRPEFNVVDMAAVHAGAVPFSIYATSTVDQMRYLLADSAARVAFTERMFAPKLREAAT
jgi:long-subunit acyl-CoA synthetase (AMP-forming)